ncbi:MAG: hypothetical protein WC238_04915 [Parcubacteria group bacterium]|jgi:hypothetical protein
MIEENKIQDAEVEEIKPIRTPVEEAKRARRDFYVELALFLVLGILIGFAVKTEAAKRITIGFDDYKMKAGVAQYNINKLQADFLNKQMRPPENQDPSAGATCTNDQPDSNQ